MACSWVKSVFKKFINQNEWNIETSRQTWTIARMSDIVLISKKHRYNFNYSSITLCCWDKPLRQVCEFVTIHIPILNFCIPNTKLWPKNLKPISKSSLKKENKRSHKNMIIFIYGVRNVKLYVNIYTKEECAELLIKFVNIYHIFGPFFLLNICNFLVSLISLLADDPLPFFRWYFISRIIFICNLIFLIKILILIIINKISDASWIRTKGEKEKFRGDFVSTHWWAWLSKQEIFTMKMKSVTCYLTSIRHCLALVSKNSKKIDETIFF